MRRLMPILLPLFLFLFLIPGCPDGRLGLLDEATGAPLADTAYRIWIDDGIRCVAPPCSTMARSLEGRTDAEGRLPRPELGPDESFTVEVEGYRAASPPKDGSPLRLQRPVPRAPPSPGLTLRAHLQPGTPTLELSAKNEGDAPFVLVRPRAASLVRYGEWGGWHLLVKVGGVHYLPDPLPGPFVPPSPDDLLTLAPGAEVQAKLELGRWRAAIPGELQSQGRPLADFEGRLEVQLRWSSLPAHLQAERPAPRALASARTQRQK